MVNVVISIAGSTRSARVCGVLARVSPTRVNTCRENANTPAHHVGDEAVTMILQPAVLLPRWLFGGRSSRPRACLPPRL